MSTAAAGPDESLARFIPADVGLYIEGRHVDDLLLPLSEPQAWLALAELAGQPASLEETDLWRQRVRATVQMNPSEALRVLLSDQFAFVAEGPRRARDSVLLCRPTIDNKTLTERWQAQPLPTAGRTSEYRLPNRVGLALPNGLLMFGDAALPDGMYRRVLEFVDLRDGGSLAADPVYRRLLARVSERPDAVLFARLHAGRTPASVPTSAPATQPAVSRLPGPLRGAANILLALHRGNGRLHFSAVGDASNHRQKPRSGLKTLVERLPESTLLTWGLHLDYPALLRTIDVLPRRSVLRITLKLQERSGTAQQLADALGSATCLAVGTVEPRSRTVTAPPVPAVALLVATREPAIVAAELDRLAQSTASIYNLMSLKVGAALLPPVEKVPLGDVQASRLDLTELIRALPGGASIGELHFCWAIDAGVLIVASHTDWLLEILTVRHGQGPALSGTLGLSPHPIAADSETIIAAQTGRVADLGKRWLAYLEQAAPQALREEWWRSRQPGGGNVRLGIQVTELPVDRRLRVTAVSESASSAGVLKPGDEITGCNGRRFATSQPVREIRAAIEQRPKARWVDIEFERAGSALVGRVPLPFVDPVQMLRRAIAVGGIARQVVYHDDVPEQAGARGFLTIELGQPAP